MGNSKSMLGKTADKNEADDNLNKSQVQIMEKSYQRMERRNTKFRIGNINASDHHESVLESKDFDSVNKMVVESSKDTSSRNKKSEFMSDLVSQNQTDPDYKKGSKKTKQSIKIVGLKSKDSQKTDKDKS